MQGDGWGWLLALVQVRGDALDQGEDLRARERMGAQDSVPRWKQERERQGSGVVLGVLLKRPDR